MTRDDILRLLAAHRDELRRRGVTSLHLFGSVARGEARPGSDVDLMVEFDPAAGADLFDLMDLEAWLSDLLGRRVDLVPRTDLKPRVRDGALRDAVDPGGRAAPRRLAGDLNRIALRCAALPVPDDRSEDEILGYDE